MEIKTQQLNETGTLIQQSLPRASSYSEYRELVAQLTEQRSTTGAELTEALVQYTQLNNSRMKRLDKTTRIPEHIQQKFEEFAGKQTWLVLTESWCGDAAQSMPAMNKLAELNPNIELKVVLRDENPALMDAFLTNGSRSIPKLIVLDSESRDVINDWGPRPSVAAQMVNAFKKEHGKLTPEFKQDLQVWYNRNKSQNIIENLSDLID